MHHVDVKFAEHLRQIITFLQANAMLARDRSAVADAHAHDLAGELFGAFERARFAAIIQYERMQVAIAGVENIGDANVVLRA